MTDEPQNTPQPDPTPPAPPEVAPQNAPQPDTPPAPEVAPQDTPPTDQTPPAPEPNKAEALDILEIAKGDEAKKAEADAKAKSDFDAYVKAAGFEDGVADALIRKGENGAPDTMLPAREVGAILTATKAAGIPADKAAPMLGIVAALDAVRRESTLKEEENILRQLRQETASEFGDNLGVVARDMVSGGMTLFGAELWQDLAENARALLNDKRFVRAMATYGARLRNDNGGPPPSPGSIPRADRIVLDLASWNKGSGGV